ncbi:HBL/NHE enterotoxin family protein [Streptomyces sp. NPDC101194]|uniref:HBL/NHE enterotoxin family protein n=1 Tax=Streptomyces sp. NPDC101194 TaxID=3366127 RepID=UPI003808C5BC
MSDALAAALEKQEKLGRETAGQGTLTALVQAHSLGIMQQPKPDFSRIDNKEIRDYEGTVKNVLDKAAENAQTYLSVVQPKSIAVLGKVENYFRTLGTFTDFIREADDPGDMAGLLRALREQAGEFMDATKGFGNDMNAMVSAFSGDKQGFDDCATELHRLVNGQDGALEKLQGRLDQVNASIHAATIGAAVSGGAILAGAGMILIGCCTSIFTGGLGLGVAIGGGVLIVGGIAGGIGTGIALANLFDEKRSILADQAQIESGVKLLTACGTGLADLGSQAGGVASAAQNTTNGWNFLKGALNSAADNIERAGKANLPVVRSAFLKSIERSLPQTLEQLSDTRKALVGLETVTRPNTHTGDLIRAELKKAPQLVG